jgi:drug/metabolite transporter (DMT)-like permease
MDKAIYIKALSSVLGISIGQIFLKLSAMHVSNENIFGFRLGKYLYINIYLIAGVTILGGATLLWIWILRSVPLSIAYPFMALAFVLVPAFSYFIFDEAISWMQVIGFLLIATGVVVASY